MDKFGLQDLLEPAGLQAEAGPCDAPASSAHHNNFDLMRLLAASQVTIVHLCEHLQIDGGAALRVLQLFPGVPVFFFVSGFLVSQSLERSTSLKSYAIKRALRIYPALWGCLAASVFLVALFKTLPWTSGSFAAWIVAQVTIGQFYNPGFLRDFGVGVLNGSLWTIPVELQFYVALPLIYALARRFGAKVFWLAALASLAGHALFLSLFYGSGSLPAKLLQVTVLPWLGLFMIGVLAQRHWDLIRSWFHGRALLWLAAYGLAAGVASQLGWSASGNAINGLSALVLFAAILSAAHTVPSLAGRLLRGNDISYGLYLYHALALNAYLELRKLGSLNLNGGADVAVLFAIAVTAAVASWLLVERPALTLKHNKGLWIARSQDAAQSSARAPWVGR